MRDSVTADDLAIEAAKQKLADLKERDEYKAAMSRILRPVKGPKIITGLLCASSTTGAAALSFTASGLVWLGVASLGALAGFMGLAWLGLSREKPSDPYGVAVVGKTRSDGDVTELQLLRVDGERVTAIVTDTIYNVVKTGDVGVVWLRKSSSFYVVTEFARL